MASIDGVRTNVFRGLNPRALDSSRLGSGRSVLGSGTGLGGFDVSANEASAPGLATVRGPGSSAAAFEVAPLTAGMLAAVQEYGSEPPLERAARRQGMLLLRQLGLLQLSLLADGPDEASLERLSSLVVALDEATSADINPELRKLLRSLALRARLELVRQNECGL